MSLVPFLREIQAFSSLDDASLELLASRCEPVEFAAGEKIVKLGEPGDAMYLIQEGRASACVTGSKNRGFVAQLAEGDFFGEMALLTNEPRNNDVIAESRVRAVRIARDPMLTLLKSHSHVAGFLTEILGQRLLESGSLNQVGKYRVLGQIGQGGMARVFEGRHRTLGTTVAIKMLSHAHVLDEVWNRRFRRESRILAELHHENIVQVIDFEEAYATLFIITELIDGVGLYQMLQARGVFPFEEARSILTQLSLALEYAHARGVVHRDVKPGNVIIEPDGRVKLMDFGIAKPLSEAGRESDDLLGTPEYMSPEQGRGEPMDGRTDIYSLGILAYELLTGRPPFQSDKAIEILDMHEEDDVPDVKSINPDVPDDLAEMVRRATLKDPRDRFQHCYEIAAMLEVTRPTSIPLSRARSRSVTLLYEGNQEAMVEGLLKRIREEVDRVPGVNVSISRSTPIE